MTTFHVSWSGTVGVPDPGTASLRPSSAQAHTALQGYMELLRQRLEKDKAPAASRHTGTASSPRAPLGPSSCLDDCAGE